MSKSKRKENTRRNYSRFTRHERNTIEHMLDRGKSCREIALELGRAASSVYREIERHRFVTSPKAHYKEPAPHDLTPACPKLGVWPRCCNGCVHKRGYGCGRKPRVHYIARLAQNSADAVLCEARRGIDESEESIALKLHIIKDRLSRGLSPACIAAMNYDKLALSVSTIYRWIDRGFGDMSNMDLRRKVGYKPRQRKVPRRTTSHTKARSYACFLDLGEEVCASAWEMDTIEGTHQDTQRLLTLLHRPSRFQLALPIEDARCESVIAILRGLRDVLGASSMQRIFSCVLTDNGGEFRDEAALARIFGEQPLKTRLFFCDPRQSQQKGACEKNHVEIRKLLPKGRGVRFDRLTRQDCALLMSQINSEPRGSLAWMSPYEVFVSAFGTDAQKLLEALGIEKLSQKALNLTPHCLEQARTQRGEMLLT